MRAAAQQRGVDVRYGVQLVSFTVDDEGVSATLQETATSQTHTFHADYLVACDGAHSHIRQTLGIPTSGYGVLPEHFIFVYFRAPWQELIAGHEADAFMIKNPGVQGVFLVADRNLGMFLIQQRSAPGQSVAELSSDQCRNLIQKAIGDPGIPAEIVDIARWQPAESIASRFQDGRVFLVGDAAHTMPAYKGLGVNTAIQSAQNLAWKLGAVLRGQAGARLLGTYQAERQPIGAFAAHQSLVGPGADWLMTGKTGNESRQNQDLPVFYPIVGYRYRSEAVVPEDASEASGPELALLDAQELTGLPGSRLPHAWLERSAKRISTLDLLDGRFVVLAARDGTAWCAAASRVGPSLGIDLAAYRIGPDADLRDPEGRWPANVGVAPDGAVLVRPDGFIAWRSQRMPEKPEQMLEQVLDRILCRTEQGGR